jgi:hypothetical protein
MIPRIKTSFVFEVIAVTTVTALTPLAALAQKIPMIQSGLPGAQHEAFINTVDRLLNGVELGFDQVMSTQDKVRHGLYACQQINQGVTVAQIQREIADDTQISPEPVIPELAELYASNVIVGAVSVYCNP